MDNSVCICDTNVFLSALLSKTSPPNRSVRYLLANGMLAFSKETLDELEEVFSRKKFDKYIPRAERAFFIENVKQNSLVYEIHHSVDICRDPKDNKFLDVAIASYADYLITGDEDLLVLEAIGNTTIITPREFINIFTSN